MSILGFCWAIWSLPLTLFKNDVLSLDQLRWRSDFFTHSLWPWYRAWPSPNYEWFPWSICNGCGMPAGNAYPSGHLVSYLLGLAYAPIIETSFPQPGLSFFDFSLWISLGTFSIVINAWVPRVTSYTLKLHSHQTIDQPPINPDQFLWLCRVWSGKITRSDWIAYLSPINPAVSVLFPWCTHAQIPLFPTYSRPSSWPIPALHDQPRPIPDSITLTTLNVGPIPDLISTPGLKWIIQANVISTDSLMWVQYRKCAHHPYY